MRDEPTQHRRRSLRLQGYDYAQAGAYFVTICTDERACLFGHVADGAMQLNDAGWLVATCWIDMPARFPEIALDMFVVMPNHVHGILLFADNADRGIAVGAPLAGARERTNEAAKGATTRVAPTVGNVVGAFKSLSTAAYIRGVKDSRWPALSRRLWQRNYYEHVIRDETDLSRIRRYIDENPIGWEFDDENPQRIETGAIHET